MAPLDKTPPFMAEWRAHDESFMFARERDVSADLPLAVS